MSASPIRRRVVGLLSVALLAALLLAGAALATPEYAARTGLKCADCHTGPAGGEINQRGAEFKAAGYRLDAHAPGAAWRLLVLLAGFLHVVTAVVWFGAIIYIHLFVKPRQLIKGLPKGEMLLGRFSILAIVLSGAVLTVNRVHAWNELWTTTFGIVLLVKLGAFALMVAIAAITTTIINRRLSAPSETPRSDLSAADGREGRPAHIVYDNVLYDVSASRMWANGQHMGRHRAGNDLTAALAGAPHDHQVLQRVKNLGPAAAATAPQASAAARLFVFFAYAALVLIALILLCVAWWNWGPPLVGAGDRSAVAGIAAENVSPGTRLCIECHHREAVQPLQIEEWAAGRHAAAGVGCLECHRANEGESDAYQHHGALIATIVSPRDCGRCHKQAAREFEQSRHSQGGRILASLDNVLGEVVEGVPAGVSGCQQCHGSTIAVGSDGRLGAASWPNTGIGRINPDGSRGACSACHPRHRFAAAVARRPESCGRCHMGPDHPQHEIFNESKHGVAFAESLDRMNLRAPAWRLGTEYAAAPTCVTCHNGATANLEFTHDVGQRIAWTLRPAISTRLPEWEARRDRMASVCGQCHSPGWTDNFFTQFDNTVELYNTKFAEPATAIMDELRAAGKISPQQFDDEIEWTYFLLWHHEGRRARHGAAMMGPDFTQWHGFFEVAERFYIELVPQAEALKPGVTAPYLATEDHQWLRQMPADLRERVEQYYSERYGRKP